MPTTLFEGGPAGGRYFERIEGDAIEIPTMARWPSRRPGDGRYHSVGSLLYRRTGPSTFRYACTFWRIFEDLVTE